MRIGHLHRVASFYTLCILRMRSGTSVSIVPSPVAAALPQLQTGLGAIASTRGHLGINLISVTSLVNDANSQSTMLQASITNLVGVDVPQAAAREQEALLQQQALVSLGSSLGKMPLINILA